MRRLGELDARQLKERDLIGWFLRRLAMVAQQSPHAAAEVEILSPALSTTGLFGRF